MLHFSHWLVDLSKRGLVVAFFSTGNDDDDDDDEDDDDDDDDDYDDDRSYTAPTYFYQKDMIDGNHGTFV